MIAESIPKEVLTGSTLEVVGLLIALSLAPFLLGMVTCFTKMVVVGGLLRQALGTNQVPPNSVITGMALLLTVHVMTPVAKSAWVACEKATAGLTDSQDKVPAAITAGCEVVGGWLRAQSSAANLEFFQERPAAVESPGDSESVARASRLLTVEAPAFLLTELQEAFVIGFIILLPFLIIDLVIGNVLMALGMMMVSPQVIALPFKILFFVALDGWTELFGELLANYPTSAM